MTTRTIHVDIDGRFSVDLPAATAPDVARTAAQREADKWDRMIRQVAAMCAVSADEVAALADRVMAMGGES